MATWMLDLVAGNDANNGTTWALRKLTMGSVLASASAGDTILIAETGAHTTVTANFTFTNKSATVTAAGDVTGSLAVGDYIAKNNFAGNGTSAEIPYRINAISYSAGTGLTTITTHCAYYDSSEAGAPQVVSSVKKITFVTCADTANYGLSLSKDVSLEGGYNVSTGLRTGETWIKGSSARTNTSGATIFQNGPNGSSISYINTLDNYYALHRGTTAQTNVTWHHMTMCGHGFAIFNSGTGNMVSTNYLTDCVANVPNLPTQTLTYYLKHTRVTIIGNLFVTTYPETARDSFVSCKAYCATTGFSNCWSPLNCEAAYCDTGFTNATANNLFRGCKARACSTVGWSIPQGYTTNLFSCTTDSCAIDFQYASTSIYYGLLLYLNNHTSINAGVVIPTSGNLGIEQVVVDGMLLQNSGSVSAFVNRQQNSTYFLKNITVSGGGVTVFSTTGGHWSPIPQFVVQNAGGKTGTYWGHASCEQDTTTTPYSLKLTYTGPNGNIPAGYDWLPVATLYNKSGTAITVTLDYWLASSTWTGTMTPRICLNGVTLITGTPITTIDLTHRTMTFTVTAPMMTADGELSIEMNMNSTSATPVQFGNLGAV